jgi:hypothetical protein
MSRAGKQQVVSNRTRNIQNGAYTDIFRREEEQERTRRRNLNRMYNNNYHGGYTCKIKW